MDIFDHRDFKIIKTVLHLAGQWPFQSAKIRKIILVTVLLICSVNFLGKIHAIVGSDSVVKVLLEDMSLISSDLVVSFKYLNGALKMSEMRELLTRMRRHYASMTNENELKIMRGYTGSGRKFTIIYLEFFLANAVMYLVPPLFGIIANNGTDRPTLQRVDYGIDPQEYYYPIIVESYLTIFIIMSIFIVMDPPFVMFTQHACALYTALGDRISNIGNEYENLVDFNPSKNNDESYKEISICIRRHQEAIEFSVLLDSYYSTTFFLQVLVNTIGLSVAGIQAMKSSENMDYLLQQVVIIWTAIAHMFFICFNGQRLIVHSTRIHEYLIEAKWYQTSIRSTQLMNLMIVRSQYPCTLTAAGLLVLSMETFSAVMRTSMSYFTVLRSTQ